MEDTRTGFLRQSTAKVKMRYAQAPDTINGVYMPRLPGIDWVDLLRQPAEPLVITEGELKAACAVKHGIPTVGLGGVWNWKSSKHDLKRLPWFDTVEWRGRSVYLVFDSDISSNQQVAAAEYALAHELTRSGATVYPVRLPGGVGAKVGLDDYLLAEGVEALSALLAAT